MLGIRRMSRGGGQRDARGAVAVEFALILPLLAMLLLGIFTFGLTYSNHLGLTNTVREGARLGATAPNETTWGVSVRDRTVDMYGDATNPLPAGNVCALLVEMTASGEVVHQSSDGNCASGATLAGAAPGTPASIPAGSCFVKVWATLPAQLNWVFVKTDLTLRAQSVAAYDPEQDCP